MSAANILSHKILNNYTKNTKNVSPRILDLRKKIHDAAYLDNAINRIAFILSRNLIDISEELRLNS